MALGIAPIAPVPLGRTTKTPSPGYMGTGLIAAGATPQQAQAAATGQFPTYGSPLTSADTTLAAQLNQRKNAYDYYSSALGYDPTTGLTTEGQNAIDAYNAGIGMTLAGRDYNINNQYRQYANNIAENNLDKANAQQDLSSVNKRLGFLQPLLNLAQQKEWYNARDLQHALFHHASASGGLTGTQYFQEQRQSIAENLANQLKTNELNTADTRAMLEAQRKTAQNQAAKYGLKANEYLEALREGIDNLKIGAYTSVQEILANINSQRAADRQTGLLIADKVLQTSGRFPTSLPSRLAQQPEQTFRSGTGYRR